MDMQLLMRLSRMAPQRILTLAADVAAAKRLADLGLIEFTMRITTAGRALTLHAVHVHLITPAGLSAVAREKSRLECRPTLAFSGQKQLTQKSPPMVKTKDTP